MNLFQWLRFWLFDSCPSCGRKMMKTGFGDEEFRQWYVCKVCDLEGA